MLEKVCIDLHPTGIKDEHQYHWWHSFRPNHLPIYKILLSDGTFWGWRSGWSLWGWR